MKKLEIKNLFVSREGKTILKDLTLTINEGEIVALMGPNGSGKSTLLFSIMGHPFYKIESGEIIYDSKNVLEMTTDERSKLGLFLAMQSPIEVEGVTNRDFLKRCVDKRAQDASSIQSVFKFEKSLDKAINELKMDKDLASRYLNDGFSGGEKKKNEILQMKILKPSISLLDEIDSGLDVDAVKIVSDNILSLKKESGMSLLIVSHYHRLYEYIVPDRVVVLINGTIVKEGDKTLIDYIDKYGFDQIKREAGIEDSVELLETCAVKHE